MQQGTMIFGALLGINHIKWGDKGDRKAGEMLTIFLCPKTDGGTLDAEPVTVSVPSENVASAMLKLKEMKQFEPMLVSVSPLPARQGERQVRFQYRGFFDLPGRK